MRNTSKKMAELTYAELTQGRESARLPHTHKFDKRIHIQT